jgi:ABC-2 type transport system permease protein
VTDSLRRVETATQRADRLASLPFEQIGRSAEGFFKGTGHAMRELWAHRELQYLLVRRELKARYKDSALGFLWTLIRPVVLLLIYYFAIGYFLGARGAIPMFAVFVFAGLTLWGLYADILVLGTVSILTNAGLIKKVYMPRELFPLASVGSALFNFVTQFLVLIAAILVLGQFPLTWDLLYVFPAIAIVLLFGTALALLLSAFNVYLRDVQYLVDVAVLMLFWASPIVYSYGMVNTSDIGGTWIESAYLANPVTIAMLAFQRALWLSGPTVQAELAAKGVDPASLYPPDLDLRLIILLVIGALLVFVAHRTFLRLQGNFAQEI